MKRLALTLTTVALMALLIAPAAQAAFGFNELDSTFTNADATQATQAGSHPFAQTVTLGFNTVPNAQFGIEVPDGSPKDLTVSLPPGLVGNPTVVPRCASVDFVLEHCPAATQVGVNDLIVSGPTQFFDNIAVYNLAAPKGVAMKIGFIVIKVPITIDLTVNPNPPYNVLATLHNNANAVPVYRSALSVWGVPADPAHNSERSGCGGTSGDCKLNLEEKPFLTLPRACEGPLATVFKSNSWENPGTFAEPPPVLTHDDATPPNPQGMSGCSKLAFSPTIEAKPTTKAASSPTGLDFSLDVKDEGLSNPEGLAASDIKKAVVTLPEGFSTNPSLAEGLNVCTEADLARESVNSKPGAGCPDASKIGTVEVQTPLLEENVNGSLFIAKPYENPFNSLLALYIVIKNPTLGIVVKQALRVENDPITGRITTVAEDLPQLPFSHFKLHFREGTRSPLASPPGCGTFKASATLTPWSGGPPLTTDSAFQIITGTGAGACPAAGAPPFHPDLVAGTINNAAATYSPFNLRLSRNDGEGEFTRFSIKLPPGITGKLAGIPFCSDAAIAAAKARTGPHGGQEELDSPSCPAASEVGRTLAGAGVGPALAYAPGKVYLAGPYNGSALSIAAITAAKVGPFDLGAVVIRSALKINPETAEVFVDATGSDPIPHIIKGIPVHARDIRVYVDRPDFVLNPTSCLRTSTASTVLGSGLDFGSASDDQPITVTSPFQAADCASLGFAPKLKLSLKGGTKRGDTPAFKAVLSARKGDANIGKAQVTLPHSEFLEQAHIKTICTRVQFAQGARPGEKCPAGSVYGYAKAITPLLDEPIEGPVFLRSSSHPLPDLVAALHSGKIDVNLVGRIDSVKGGQIRNTFESVPDAPVTKFTLTMQGGKKGLLVNSTNLCKGTNRAIADFGGQNGKRHLFNPVLEAKCGKGSKGKKK
jgi:hypothetical protein